MKGKEHSLILGIIFSGQGVVYALFLLLFLLLFGVQTVFGLVHNADIMQMIPALIIYVIILVFYFVMFSVLGIAGWKLLKNKKGARTWGIFASIFSLPFIIPLGLLITIYGLWFFLSDVGRNYFQGYDETVYTPQYNQPYNPQPNSWQ